MDSSDREWTQKYIADPLSATASSSAEPSRAAQRSPSYHRGYPSPPSIDVKSAKSKSKSPSHSSIPTPPSSASPTSGSFHSSNPFAQKESLDSPSTVPRAPRIEISRSPAPRSTRPPSYHSTLPSDHFSGSPRPRSSSAHVSPPLIDLDPPRQRSASSHRSHRTHQRNSSLTERFPGDMSHRPLDMIKRENKQARRHRRGPSLPDTIDALDTIGGGYHHDGPYDATLASRNTNVKYSPVAAVRDSNMEAIRATPREFIQDSLERHVPLQGTSTVPNGGVDFGGRTMTYEEGADLMREQDAAGGPYKRYDHVRYHPDDLKGKGEPSYTYERDLKAKKRQNFLHPEQQPGDFEMRGFSRQRSLSNGANDAATSGLDPHDGIQRSNTTGKSGKLGDGIRRRFGSLRKKKDMPAEQL